MTPSLLSIVAPVYNEAAILTELVARCTRAAEASGLPFEVVIADDASTDASAAILAELTHDPRVRHCRLPANAGQFGATQAGIRAARGTWVAVLDGDLQDPPELIPEMIAALSAADASVLAILAVKSSRDDPTAFMLGQYVFHWLQQAFSRVALPLGAGSYCLMREPVARCVGGATLKRANLSAVVALAAGALGGRLATVSYDKGPRYDEHTRVGFRGLVAEALESLEITGALSRFTLLVAAGCGAAALMAWRRPDTALALLAAAGAAVIASVWLGRRARRALASVRAARDR